MLTKPHLNIIDAYMPKTLDIEFRHDGPVIHRAFEPVMLQFLSAGTRWYISPTGDLLQAAAANVPRYDISGGLWGCGPDVQLVPYNAGANSASADYWTSANITATWDTTHHMLTEGTAGATKLVASGGLGLHLLGGTEAIDAGGLDDIYLLGFLVGIPNEDENVVVTDYCYPVCGNNDAGANDAFSSGVNTRSRFLRMDGTTAYVEVWEKATISLANNHPGLAVIENKTVYEVATTMYLASGAVDNGGVHGGHRWRNCVVRPGAGAVSTTRETMNVLCANPERLLPANANGPWAVALEVSYGLHPDDYDDAEIANDQCYYWTHAKEWRGCVLDNAKNATLAFNVQTLNPPVVTAAVAHGVLMPSAPFESRWFGMTNEYNKTGQVWVKPTLAELFRGTADGTFDDVMPSGCHQFSDGFQLLVKGVTADTCSGVPGAGSCGNAKLHRLMLFADTKAALS